MRKVLKICYTHIIGKEALYRVLIFEPYNHKSGVPFNQKAIDFNQKMLIARYVRKIDKSVISNKNQNRNNYMELKNFFSK